MALLIQNIILSFRARLEGEKILKNAPWFKHLENGADLPTGGLSAPPLHQLSGSGISREWS